MEQPLFKDIPGTYDDIVELIDGDKSIRVRNKLIVEQAIKFLCKCGPNVRSEVISELANPNQWAVQLTLTHCRSCHCGHASPDNRQVTINNAIDESIARFVRAGIHARQMKNQDQDASSQQG